MRFGLLLLSAQFPGRSHSAVLDATVATAVAAEEAGFDDVWVAEHHFMSYGVCPSALTLAGYLLGATRRITVGTAVTVLSTQHPVAVAEQALLLDQVSGGRFRLGVGRGGPWVDLLVFGSGPERRGSGFPESLDLLLAALHGGPVRGAGPLFTFPEVDVVPRPRSGPRPDVVVAATTTATVRLAARRGLPLLLGMHADDAEKAAAVADWERIAGPAAGHVSVGIAHVADTDADAGAELCETLPRWLGPGLAGYRRADGAPHRTRDPHAYAEHLCRIHPVGSPATCRERLTRTAAATGVDHVVLMVEGTGEPDRTAETIRRLGAEVLPHLGVTPTG
ncbi:LLM class flavin-dependent oxidoreductase [Pseudonocardia humida]|uniref:LLM class flavin-dependent oxidoreductase n=1 Tax=Pseudonocardia humida TaxID=2800819 RepID=A0ABT1ACE9_9PSEU|nr:LLM class flavin-dependent oxidoreductase [Pseudonocardia humida]MCO1660590.1 LLM class flavin-dependent oxidoreductase [Pseudonocardia humida]